MNSPTWSVYDGEPDPASAAADDISFVSGPPLETTLKYSGLKKKEMLQRGSQGVVYAAYDTKLAGSDKDGSTLVAVKRLFLQRQDFGLHGILEPVLREITLMRYIDNAIAELHKGCKDSDNRDASPLETVGTTEDARPLRLLRVVEAPYKECCLILEYCQTDLRRLLIRKKLNPMAMRTAEDEAAEGERCPIMSQMPLVRFLLRRIFAMVAFLHNHCHILHRDLKLSNILVTKEGHLRLSDFGSARFLHPASAGNFLAQNKAEGYYTSSSVRTTMIYQPPETLLGSQAYDTCLDVWSLGVIFAELLLQHHLFRAESELALISSMWKLLGAPANDPIHVTSASANKQATLPLKFPPSVVEPDGFDLLRRMLCVDAGQRISLRDALAHPFLTSGDVAADDAEGRKLWLQKLEESAQREQVSSKVKMAFKLGVVSDDSEDDDDDDVCDPPGFTLQLH